MSDFVGKGCPICNKAINAGDEVMVCPSCAIPHHKACWEKNKGCSTFGCLEQRKETTNANPASCAGCGAALSAGQMFCPACGARITPGEEPSTPSTRTAPKRNITKIGVIAAVAVVALITVWVAVSSAFSPIKKFTSAVKGGSFEVAITIYNDNKSDRDFKKKAEDVLDAYLADLRSDFAKDKIDYKAATDKAQGVAELINIADTNTYLRKLNDSKKAYLEAEKALEGEDYYAALTQYSKVAKEDADNFAKVEKATLDAKAKLIAKATADAQTKMAASDYQGAIDVLREVEKAGFADASVTDLMSKAKDDMSAKIRNDAIAAADGLVAKGDYLGAYKALKALPGEHSNDTVTQKLASIKAQATQKTNADAQALFDKGDFLAAYDLIDSSDKDLLDTASATLKTKSQEQYKQVVLTDADTKAQAGDYAGAVALLDVPIRKFADADLKSKRDVYALKQMEGEQLLTVVKTRVEPSYIYADAYVQVRNNSQKVVKEYSVAMIQLDSSGYPVNNKYDSDNFDGYKNVHAGRSDSANLQPGATSSANKYWWITGGTRKILACVIHAEFYDGTTWYNPYYTEWVKLYAEKPVLD